MVIKGIRKSWLVILCLFAGAAHSETLSPKDIAKNTFPSFVTIATFDALQNPIAIGSGFFISAQEIVTNYHVIKGASYVNARLSEKNNSFHITAIVSSDENKDLAILKTDKTNLSFLNQGNSDSLSVGEKIYALGNPEGLEGTFSEGIVSGVRRAVGLIQITAPISPGSSGGPILNSSGEVIAVAVAFMKEGQNLNFAVPINQLKAMSKKPSRGDVKPLQMQENGNDTNSPIKIAEDLTVTDHWFFIGFNNEQFKSSFAKSNAKAIKQGQLFGVMAIFSSPRSKIHTKLILSIPEKAENFPFHSKTAKVSISDDHKTVTVEDEVAGSKGSVGYYWGTDQKDPIGKYAIKLYVEGTAVEEKDFSVTNAAAAPDVVLDNSKTNSETKITADAIRDKAGMCPVATIEDTPYNYLRAFASMLSYARMARDENQIAMSGKVEQSLLHFDKAKQYFACASLQVVDYQESKDQNVALSSNAAIQSLNDLYAVSNFIREQMKDALNGKSKPQGDMADDASQITLAADNAWMKLVPEGIIVTHSLVDSKRQGYLLLTKKQKTDVIQALEKSVKKNYKKDDRALEVTVKTLVKFFEQNWNYKP